ncbi:MAG: UDP-N-acetylmuramate--L-alanine ligase [Calditrichaceae bacterium]|nr:UDP-N-acetylmuramate--L-alanine ligase [Calditrichaceae bacterium]RQV96654.1 MAG: UDP-N-acetylmuramate--L-alanine ligase [Calditrichota bacterium]
MTELNLSGKKKIHFVGIGGIGMSGLADILLEQGYQVSGSDRQKSALTGYLESRGALIYEGHKDSNIDQADLLVYSSAIGRDNPEIVKARQTGITIVRRAEMLGYLMKFKFGIGVAGTHGKTTTTSMLGEILIKAGFDPTLVIGGRLKSSMTNARLGKGDILLAEADEYDRSFLTLNPRIAVITSIESDHLDIYRDLDDILNTFLQYVRCLHPQGILIVNGDDENIKKIKSEFNCKLKTFGLKNGVDFKAENMNFEQGRSSFDIKINGDKAITLNLQVPGMHNIRNALASFAAAWELNVSPDKIAEALNEFQGVERRFDVLAEVGGILVVDDYAHHPTEIEETLKSARSGWQRRLVVVFQPHLYSRTRDFYKEFAKALSLADLAIVTEIYPARETPIPGISGKMIYESLREMGAQAVFVPDKTKLPEELNQITKSGDLLITMGAGDITEVGRRFVQMKKES